MGVMMIHIKSVWLTFISHVDICYFHPFIQTHSVADYPWKDFKGINQETDTYQQTTQVHEEAETRLWWSYSHTVPGQPRNVSSFFVVPWERESLLLHFPKLVFGKKPSPPASLSLEMQSMIPVLCGHFLLNEIPSRLHFLLGQTVVEHQDVSEHSLPSGSTLFQRVTTALFSCQVATAQQWIKAQLQERSAAKSSFKRHLSSFSISWWRVLALRCLPS